jgi:hypothetical protein
MAITNPLAFEFSPNTLASYSSQMTNYNGISRSLALGRILYFEALMRRRLGEPRPARYYRLHNYYAQQNLPPDNVDQPLMINYVKQIVDKHTAYLWGQFDTESTNHLIDFRLTPLHRDEMSQTQLDAATKVGRKIKNYLDQLYDWNLGDVTLWDASKNGCLYGDSVLHVRYSEVERRPVWESVLPEYFYCIWDIADPKKLQEVLIAYPIDRVIALEQYGTSGNDHFVGYQVINPFYTPGIGILWQRWSTTSYQVWIDDVNRTNDPNPYMPIDTQGLIYPGLIPFIHVPNMQAGAEYWGYGDAEAVLSLIDELNRRLSDIGDIVNTHAHPIIVLKNFFGEIEKLEVGPDSLWDVGKDTDVERLEGTAVNKDVMAYIDKLQEILQETSNLPHAAFGSSRGGTSHQSGLALSMALLPVVERAREKRMRWTPALRKLIRMSFYMMAVRDPYKLREYGFSYEDTLNFTIDPVWSPILPKDRLETVNEYVARTVNMLTSIPSALAALGVEDVASEYSRIKTDALFKATVGQPLPPAGGGTGGKNSDEGSGGSSSLPGGISAGLTKPGGQIKDPELDQGESVGLNATV